MRLDLLLDWLVVEGRKEILKKYRADSCIESSLIAGLVLKHFGFKSVLFTSEVMVCNEAMVKWLDTHELSELKTKEEMDVFGGWMLQIGNTGVEKDNGFDGHLVLIVKDMFLLDMSLEQASRPAKNIKLEPIYFSIEPSCKNVFLQGKGKASININGCFVAYHLHPENQLFLKSPAFKRQETIDAADLLILKVNRTLKNQ